MILTTISSKNPKDNPSGTAGNKTEVSVSDGETQQLLTDTVKELKKMNLHLSIMTDMDIQNSEIE